MLLLLGETRDEFGGSEWAQVVHGHLGGLPPTVDLEAEQLLAEVLVAGARDQLLRAARPVRRRPGPGAGRDGAARGQVGVQCHRRPVDPFVALFSESTARAVVAVSAARTSRLS